MKRLYINLSEADALTKKAIKLRDEGKTKELEELLAAAPHVKRAINANTRGKDIAKSKAKRANGEQTAPQEVEDKVLKKAKKDKQYAKAINTRQSARNRNDYNTDAYREHFKKFEANAIKRGKTYDAKEMERRAKASFASSEWSKRKKLAEKNQKVQQDTQTDDGVRMSSSKFNTSYKKAKDEANNAFNFNGNSGRGFGGTKKIEFNPYQHKSDDEMRSEQGKKTELIKQNAAQARKKCLF